MHLIELDMMMNVDGWRLEPGRGGCPPLLTVRTVSHGALVPDVEGVPVPGFGLACLLLVACCMHSSCVLRLATCPPCCSLHVPPSQPFPHPLANHDHPPSTSFFWVSILSCRGGLCLVVNLFPLLLFSTLRLLLVLRPLQSPFSR